MAEQSDVNADLESAQDGAEVQYDELAMLIERVDTLEETVDHITQQQGTLTHRLREYAESLDDITDTVDSLRDNVQELEKETELRDSRINNITRSLDTLEESLQDTRGDIEQTSDKLGRRLTAIENMMDLDEVDIAQAVKPNACELEQLTTIPEESRDDEFDVRVQRAIALYEHFHDISEPVKSGGRRVLSRNVKTFLNGYSDMDIAYSQVQRVIDSFDEKTDDTYTTVQTSDGRAILWKPDES